MNRAALAVVFAVLACSAGRKHCNVCDAFTCPEVSSSSYAVACGAERDGFSTPAAAAAAAAEEPQHQSTQNLTTQASHSARKGSAAEKQQNYFYPVVSQPKKCPLLGSPPWAGAVIAAVFTATLAMQATAAAAGSQALGGAVVAAVFAATLAMQGQLLLLFCRNVGHAAEQCSVWRTGHSSSNSSSAVCFAYIPVLPSNSLTHMPATGLSPQTVTPPFIHLHVSEASVCVIQLFS
jgi:hypothetical protein